MPNGAAPNRSWPMQVRTQASSGSCCTSRAASAKDTWAPFIVSLLKSMVEPLSNPSVRTAFMAQGAAEGHARAAG